jgi:hypothetical protein
MVARRGTHCDLEHRGGAQGVRNGVQGLPRIGFTGNRGAAELLERFDCVSPLLPQRLVDCPLRLGPTGLGVDQPPALRHPPVGRGQRLRVLACPQREHWGGGGLHEGVLCCSQGGRDAGDPATAGVGELLEVPCTVQGAIRHQGARAIGRMPPCEVGSAQVSKVIRVAGMATEWWHQQRDPCLVLHNPVQPDLVEVGALIPAVAPRDVKDMGVGRLGTVVAAVDGETRAVQGRKPRRSLQSLGGGDRHKTVELCHPIFIARIQGAPQRVIMEMRGVAPRGHERVRRCVLKK